jgi:hypothetical protein
MAGALVLQCHTAKDVLFVLFIGFIKIQQLKGNLTCCKGSIVVSALASALQQKYFHIKAGNLTNFY